MSTLKQFLSKPFPQEESFAETLKIITAISIFVVVFLYVFKPFGIHVWQPYQFLLCLAFGAVTFVSSLIYEYVIVRILKVKGEGANFTFGRWIVYFFGVMLFISLANFLFVRLVILGSMQWELFPYMLRGTFAVGMFPVIGLGAYAVMRQERKYQSIAAEFNQQEPVTATRGSPDDYAIFDIPSRQIRFIEAMQNYIKIQHLDLGGELKEQVERATLKSVSEQLVDDTIVRCHRSFFVNRDAIVSTTGNAQGLLLTLKDCDRQVPVSRSYVAVFKQRQS